MSRKRSEAAIEAHHANVRRGRDRDARRRRPSWPSAIFDDGRAASPASASRRRTAPPSGCSPTSRRGCASTTRPSSSARCSNEQPMGFYPPDALVHEAQRRGIDDPAARRQRQRGRVHGRARSRTGTSVARIGLGLRARASQRRDEREALVAARAAGGPFRDARRAAARAGAGRPALELLAWSGACDALRRRRPPRVARCGAWASRDAGHARAGQGTQLALAARAAGRAGAARARRLGGDARRLRHDRPDRAARTRSRCCAAACRAERGRRAATSSASRTARACRSAGMVVARQRPGTASGVVFMLLEDEHGTINLIVPPKLYERSRLTVRTEPLRASPRAAGAPSGRGRRRSTCSSSGSTPLGRRPSQTLAAARSSAARSARGAVDDFRAVAPAVMSFAQGRRR